MSLRETVKPDIAQRRLTAADQNRRAVKEKAIDKVRRQKGGGGARSSFHEQMVSGELRDCVRRSDARDALHRPARKHDPPRSTRFQTWQTHVERRPIHLPCTSSDKNGLVTAPLEMRMGARLGTGDPAALAIRARDAAID